MCPTIHAGLPRALAACSCLRSLCGPCVGGRRDGLGWLRNGILGQHRHGLPCKLSERIGPHIPVCGFMANRIYDGVDGDDLQPGLHRRERAAVPAIGGGCNFQNVTKSVSILVVLAVVVIPESTAVVDSEFVATRTSSSPPLSGSYSPLPGTWRPGWPPTDSLFYWP